MFDFLDSIRLMDFINIAMPLIKEPLTLLIFLGFLIWAGVKDIQTLKIKDRFNLIFFSTGIILMFSHFLSKILDIDIPGLMFGWQNIAGLILGFLFLFIPAFFKNQPMGGDIKISAVVGFWLGFEAMTVILFLATILNLIYWAGAFSIWKEFGSKTLMPFAPFIALGALFFYGVTFFTN